MGSYTISANFGGFLLPLWQCCWNTEYSHGIQIHKNVDKMEIAPESAVRIMIGGGHSLFSLKKGSMDTAHKLLKWES